MAEYSLDYLEAKDIDWFFRINDIYIHVASAGGKLPDFINNRERLRQIQKQVQSIIESISKEALEYNDGFLNGYLERMNELMPNENMDWRHEYLMSFEGFARRGFISIDRTNIEDSNDSLYHVVCRPILPPKVNIDIPVIEAPNALESVMRWEPFDLFSILGID